MSQQKCLIVGNYTHDVLIKDDVILTSSLGGASSFISNILDGLSIPCSVVSKVGHDFSYFPTHPPIKLNSHQTTLFHAHFSSTKILTNHDRVLKRIHTCQSINPQDLPNTCFKFGLAVGVAGEIAPETLQKMLDICETVFVDVQSLIRVFDKKTGEVTLVNLKDSSFYHLVDRIGFLKASEDEAPFVDVEDVRKKKCSVVVTNGKEGCTVYCGDEEQRIMPFQTVQVDCTGAGDSFLGGFVAGLVNGLAVPDAALLGNFFGSLTVGQLGLPRFDSRLLQAVKDEVQKKRSQLFGCHDIQNGKLMFQKPIDHEEFLAVLGATKTRQCKFDLPKSRAVESCSGNVGATAPPRGTLEVQTKFQ